MPSLFDRLRALFGGDGLSETQRKWREEQARAERERRGAGDEGDDPAPERTPARATTKHCLACRALVSHDERRCPECDAELPSMTGLRLARGLRSLFPAEEPTTKVLLVALLGVFIVQTMAAAQALDGDFLTGLLTPPGLVLLRWGAHQPGDYEPWRIVMSNFLHFGILHFGFNAWALRIAGPQVERFFGSALAFVLFVVTGIAAMSASNLLSSGQLVAGASGSLMGFLGLAIAGGHREGTPHGIAVRDLMVRWTVFIGFLGIAAQATGFMNIANIAHAGGLVAGLALGWVLPLRRVDGRTTLGRVRLTAVATVAALGVVAYGVVGMLGSALAIQAFDECVDDLKNERTQASLESCRRAVDENPREVGAWHNLAYAYIKAERGDEAVEVCAEARAELGAAQARKSEICRTLLSD